MRTSKALFALLLAGQLAACSGTVSVDGGPGDGDDPDDPRNPDGPEAPGDDELAGAGGRDLTEYWPDIDLPYSQNTKMLSFEQMRNEVQRATGRSWREDGQDQWEAHRGVLGGADYIDIWAVDREPSQQKLVTWRKMAFRVCGAAVNADAGAPDRTLFVAVDPGAAIDPATAAPQVEQLFARFFLEAPSQTEVDQAIAALSEMETLANARQAWRGLCAAYLSSQRFLTY